MTMEGEGFFGFSRGNLASSIPVNNKEEKDKLYDALWLACAGPCAHIPRLGDVVYYFAQGHAEQVQALCSEGGMRLDMPVYNLPPKMLCEVVNVRLKAEAPADEVFSEITLFPSDKQQSAFPVVDDNPRIPLYQAKNVYVFSKILTASDTSTHGGFSVPKRFADQCFPPLDMSLQPPAQELVAKDMNGFEWRFRHIYRGQPKRHLLTSNWSAFVSSKKLVAGDTCIFLRGADGELRIGVRHAGQRHGEVTSATSVMPQNSMEHGIFASADNALSSISMFVAFYRPWTGPAPFIISYNKYKKATEKEYLPGMRFGFSYESKELEEKRHTGTIIAVEDYDGLRWPNSEWRCLKVIWDGGSETSSLPKRLSPWEIELIPPERNVNIIQPALKRGRRIDPKSSRGQNEVLQGQETSNEGFSDEEQNGGNELRLFGVNLCSPYPELPSVKSEITNSRSGRPTSAQPRAPEGALGIVSRKDCAHCTAKTRSCIKVLKYGTLLGRSVDLAQFDGYEQLAAKLDQMFEFNGCLVGGTSGWKLTYTDDEGDLMLVGDHEWQAFCVAARKIFICPEEMNEMTPEFLKSGIFSCDE